MRGEIQAYFRSVAEQYGIVSKIRFRTVVERAAWEPQSATWRVEVRDLETGKSETRRCRVLVSAVGSLSVPQACEIPGAETFRGKLFHTAQWDHSFDWKDKEVVVVGNGCSATQAVPIVRQTARRVTQFARQAHFLSERENPTYSEAFKWVMRWVPGAMRVYRFWLYADMEKDFAGFDIESGEKVRRGLKEENEKYVKRMAPERYWDVLIPKHEIGCKR